jgi:hypothetical protein
LLQRTPTEGSYQQSLFGKFLVKITERLWGGGGGSSTGALCPGFTLVHFIFNVVTPRHVKWLMNALHILYVNVEDEFMMYITTNLTCKMVSNTLTL